MKRFVWLLALTGCFTDHHSCPVYNTAGGAPEAVPAQELRDPSDGQCTAFSYPGGGGGYCDPQCGPCAQAGGPAIGAQPDWAMCYGPCTSLDETQCLASTTCHTAYVAGPGPGAIAFWGCWDLPPSGATTGSCSGVDAQTCSEHPDCTSLYTSGATDQYSSCTAKVTPPACSTLATETACKARPDCDPIYIGTNCTCDASGGTCATETYDHCTAH
jgi:hypothetical protein